jgi:N-acetylmuramoyl-L-alanine amidase
MRALAGAAALLMLPALLAVPSSARSLLQKKKLALAQFGTAEKMREALNGTPQSERTRRDYNQVAEAYRKVYHLAPTSSKANESALAVAELLAEMGRNFHDPKFSRGSIAQYEFLIREYPGNRHRAEALFTIGKIYQDDLDDGAQAKQTFQEFLKQHPRHRLSADAQQAIDDIDHPAPVAASLKQESAKQKSKPEAAASPKPQIGTQAAASAHIEVEQGQESATNEAGRETQSPADKSRGRGKLPLVTGIRHWSTPDYTRVAIDVDDEVKYEAGRIASPERIFFDLHDTKLASDLAGKSFDVDDGFLRKIRVAQYQRGLTRVVLEVDPVSEYSAFLLPNPYRLIIDIHGRQSTAKTRAVPASEIASTPALEESSNQPAAASPAATPADKTGASKAAWNSNAGLRASPMAAKNSTPSAIGDAAASSEKDIAKLRASTPPTAAAHDETTTTAATPLLSPPASVAASGSIGNRVRSAAKAKSKDSAGAVDNADEADPDTPASTSTLNRKEKEFRATSKPTSAPTFQSVSPSPVEAGATVSVAKASRRNRGANKAKSKSKNKDREVASREARPTSAGERSLIRALGLKIGKIVVDAGHGGHDTGTIGPHGLLEKDLVLDVAQRLGKLLESRLGSEVIYTREDDTFVPLETRTALANQNQADLFISIHANSSRDPGARGVETYYLNFTSSADALEVAARENAVSEKSIYELQDLVKSIALKDKMEESREFAGDVQSAMRTGLSSRSSRMRDRGVKKAPFIVLIGANMPSILAEISFVSNPGDERRLQTPEYRQKIAESLYRGVAKYVSGLSGVKLAARAERSEGQ